MVPIDIITKWENRISSNDLKALNIPFDFAKPVDLIKYLISIVDDTGDSIVLDFFSGSATTAHTVMQLNAEDGGNRKFIMVQLPEKTDEKSEAYKAGYKNICEIGKERIRRAGKKILEESGDNSILNSPNSTPDVGFRVLKLADSNMTDVFYSPSEYSQNLLEQFCLILRLTVTTLIYYLVIFLIGDYHFHCLISLLISMVILFITIMTVTLLLASMKIFLMK